MPSSGQYPVTVSFTPPTTPGGQPIWSFTGLDPNNQLTVNLSLGLIIFTLQGPAGAVFGNSPVTWNPGNTAGNMSVSRDTGTQATILDSNNTPGIVPPPSYNFALTVWYQGSAYTSSDPTIINATVPTTPDVQEEGEGHGHVTPQPALRAV